MPAYTWMYSQATRQRTDCMNGMAIRLAGRFNTVPNLPDIKPISAMKKCWLELAR